MTDREVLDEILGLLRVIAYEPDDDRQPDRDWDTGEEDQLETHCGATRPQPDSGGGGLPQVAVVKSPLSGENFLWKRRRAGDSWVEEIEGIISFGKG